LKFILALTNLQFILDNVSTNMEIIMMGSRL